MYKGETDGGIGMYNERGFTVRELRDALNKQMEEDSESANWVVCRPRGQETKPVQSAGLWGKEFRDPQTCKKRDEIVYWLD